MYIIIELWAIFDVFYYSNNLFSASILAWTNPTKQKIVKVINFHSSSTENPVFVFNMAKNAFSELKYFANSLKQLFLDYLFHDVI